ncbi:MAG: hypothetical protein Kow0029_06520 [Candidatus Rifleibacteriota bacterium]
MLYKQLLIAYRHRIMRLLTVTFFMMILSVITVFAQVATSSTESTAISREYIDDQAGLIIPEIKKKINEICVEIEQKMRIRVLIKTERVDKLSESKNKVESFFAEWIRNIGLDKRGVLIYALLPEGSAHGKVYLNVGIGLKYLITREMGEKILNQVILPNNAVNNDGQGFLEGVSTIKRMLLDELKRDVQRKGTYSDTFNLRSFFWTSKEIILAFLVAMFLCYVIFFVERCPRCNGALSVSTETLKEPGENTLGLRRRIFSCERCGFSRRKKEPVYPPGKAGWMMRLSGTRRNVKID